MCSDVANTTDQVDQGERKEDFHCPVIPAWTDRSSQQKLEPTWPQQAWSDQLLPLQVDSAGRCLGSPLLLPVLRADDGWARPEWVMNEQDLDGRWTSRTSLAPQNREANLPHVCTAWRWYPDRLLNQQHYKVVMFLPLVEAAATQVGAPMPTQFSERVEWGKIHQESCRWCSLEYVCMTSTALTWLHTQPGPQKHWHSRLKPDTKGISILSVCILVKKRVKNPRGAVLKPNCK